MRMLLFIVLLFCNSVSYAGIDSTWQNSTQNDSCNLRISVLTCGPGEDLYSIFGHSAIRVIDFSSGMDIVFNYGTMEFDDFSFYVKFTKGQMLY